jgi:acetyl-CoA carboxylase alpha subunit
LFEAMLTIDVPVISIVTGEGGSGGALAFATGDRLLIYRDATFTVIAPEGAAQILWRDPSRAPEAARLQRLTAHDLQDLGIADEVVESRLTPEGLASVLAYHLARLEEERVAGGDWARSRQTRWREPRG